MAAKVASDQKAVPVPVPVKTAFEAVGDKRYAISEAGKKEIEACEDIAQINLKAVSADRSWEVSLLTICSLGISWTHDSLAAFLTGMRFATSTGSKPNEYSKYLAVHFEEIVSALLDRGHLVVVEDQ